MLEKKRIFSQIADLSPECPKAGTFPTSRKESHKSAHRLQQRRSAVVITLGNGNLQMHMDNQIIVLTDTLCLN